MCIREGGGGVSVCIGEGGGGGGEAEVGDGRMCRLGEGGLWSSVYVWGFRVAL